MISSGSVMTATIIALLAFAALTDLALRIIPDGVSIALATIGLAVRGCVGVPGLAASLAVAASLCALLILAYARGMMGGGDVKLAAATAVGLSPEAAYRFIVATALAGGALALLHLALRRAFRGVRTRPPPRGASLSRRIAAAERWRIARRGSLPYGVAIGCGGIWTVLASPEF